MFISWEFYKEGCPYEISGFHGSEDSDVDLLDLYTV